MDSAQEIARALGGHRTGRGFLVRCPVAAHGRGRGDQNPSLSIEDDERGLLIHCFGGCSAAEVRTALEERGLVTGSRPRPARSSRVMVARIIPDPAVTEVWRSGLPIAGTLAEHYLTHHRCLTPPFPPSLRFVPFLTYPPSGLRLPAMIVGVQDSDRRLIAVQATFLRRSDGAKAPVTRPRWTYGALGSGAARFAHASGVLGLAEGTEDALSVMELTGCPCWASLGAGRMASADVPEAVCELHAFVDADTAGQAAAEALIRRQTQLGRSVVVHHPPPGRKDWNEILQHRERGQEAA